jgi:uncharacterized membrane protein YedE/YeeE
MTREQRALALRLGVLGFAFGFVLSRLGFSDWGEVHRMLAFADFRLLLSFAGAVLLTAASFALLSKRVRLPRIRLHAGTIPGALLFGIGWALSGCCPATALVQLGEGYLPAAVVFAGILAGDWLHGRFRHRLPGRGSGGCEG